LGALLEGIPDFHGRGLDKKFEISVKGDFLR
jgi:hypothetical protein